MMELIKRDVTIPGLRNTYRIMHITDAHVIAMDERDDGVVIVDGGPHNGKLVTVFGGKRLEHFTHNGVTTAERFRALCETIRDNPDCADLIVLTGDILDFFTHAALEFVTECLSILPIPYVYVMGNHDSIFYTEGEENTRRWFTSLCGGNTEIQKYKLGELAIIGIDNARDRYTEKGLAELEKALEGEEYAILCQHIPLSNEAYHEEAMRVVGVDHGLGPQSVCVDGTWKVVFDRIAAPGSPIKALFCGDCHRDHCSKIGDAVMFTTPYTAMYPPVLFHIHG